MQQLRATRTGDTWRTQLRAARTVDTWRTEHLWTRYTDCMVHRLLYTDHMEDAALMCYTDRCNRQLIVAFMSLLIYHIFTEQSVYTMAYSERMFGIY